MPYAHRTFAARRRAATDAHNCGSRRPPLRDYVVEDVGGPGAGSRLDGRRVSGTGHAVAVGGFDRRVEVNTARPSRHRAKKHDGRIARATPRRILAPRGTDDPTSYWPNRRGPGDSRRTALDQPIVGRSRLPTRSSADPPGQFDQRMNGFRLDR